MALCVVDQQVGLGGVRPVCAKIPNPNLCAVWRPHAAPPSPSPPQLHEEKPMLVDLANCFDVLVKFAAEVLPGESQHAQTLLRMVAAQVRVAPCVASDTGQCSSHSPTWQQCVRGHGVGVACGCAAGVGAAPHARGHGRLAG